METLVSICIPIHNMENKNFFLKRCLDSIWAQSYKNFEIIITQDGQMAENSNSAIKKAIGDVIKIMFMDDYFAHKDALKRIVESFKGGWLVSGCNHDDGHIFNDHLPTWNKELSTGNNTIGSPSVLTFENKEPLLFDEKLTWLLDVDLYSRLFQRYGLPTILNDINVTIGIGQHQSTYLIPNERKQWEHQYMNQK